MHVPVFGGVRGANRSPGLLSTPFILQKSRMRKRARTDLCGGRLVRVVPTATATGEKSLARLLFATAIVAQDGWSPRPRRGTGVSESLPALGQ